MTTKLTAKDISRIAKKNGLKESILRAVIDVEAASSGFDKNGRVKILFEPHKFYKNLSGKNRTLAVNQGIAYRSWGEKPYPKDSYPRLTKAMAIDATAALKSCSWGLGQIMGENHVAAGYDDVHEMVDAFKTGEAEQLEAMIRFIIHNGLMGDLKAKRFATFARGYNGPGYKKNAYDTKLAQREAFWAKKLLTIVPEPEVELPPPAPEPIEMKKPVEEPYVQPEPEPTAKNDPTVVEEPKTKTLEETVEKIGFFTSLLEKIKGMWGSVKGFFGLAKRSRTIQGALVAGTGVTVENTDLVDKITPYSEYSDWIKFFLIVLAIIGIIVVIYARTDDEKKKE